MVKRIEMKMMRMTMRGATTLLLAGSLGACGNAEADGADSAAVADDFVRVINVEVMDVVPETFEEEIRITGTVRANRDVVVSAEESGVIRKIYVDKGSRVRAGQPLVKIDDRVLQAQVDQARAQADLAAQTWARRKRLWEGDKVGSEIAYLEAKFAHEQTAANLKALEERLDRTVVRAPFSGVLDERQVELGTMVNPGQAVARLVDLDPVKVTGGIPERYAVDVSTGATATVNFDVLPGHIYEATIGYVGAAVNPRNRTFPVEVVLPNPDGLIKPEMIANISVLRRTVENAVVVPQDALIRVEEGYVVFVAAEWNEGTVAEVRPVEVGPTQRNLVVVESGLVAGEKLIVAGQKSVEDGDRVNIVGTR